MAGKARVHELAKELGVTSKEVLARLNEQGEFVKSASSTVEAPVARRLRESFGGNKPAAAGKSAPKSPDRSLDMALDRAIQKPSSGNGEAPAASAPPADAGGTAVARPAPAASTASGTEAPAAPTPAPRRPAPSPARPSAPSPGQPKPPAPSQAPAQPAPPTGRFWHDRRPRPEHYLPTTRHGERERERLWRYCAYSVGIDNA